MDKVTRAETVSHRQISRGARELRVERGTLGTAQQDYKTAEETKQKSGYKRGLANSLGGEGDVLVARNNTGGAVRLYRAALKLVEGLDEPEVPMNVHGSLGFAELLQGSLRLQFPIYSKRLALQRSAEIMPR